MIGLDIGTRRIGVAVSDELGIIATPTTTIHIPEDQQIHNDKTIHKVIALVREYGARRVVAGLPRNMKGERGVQAEWTERFVAALRDALRGDHVPVSLYDERLTTVAAEKVIPRRATTPAQRKREQTGRHSVDARAAALILQGYLDRQRHRERQRLDEGNGES